MTDFTNPLASTATASGVGPAPVAPPEGSAAERAKIRELAHQFEALLLTQMLKEMRRSMLDEESEGSGLGNETMTETVDTELAQALSRAGGFGLGDVLSRALDRQQGGRSSTTAVEGTATPLPGQAPELTMPSNPGVTMPAGTGLTIGPGVPVTSGYGWRLDPINRQVRFHSGADLRMAYGQEVRAAGGGRVAFAGEQSGYGLTVVIDHGDGLETRYAHLSGYSVQPGEAVASGQVVARSGNSGRSTGAHLHFEVLQNGRSVDPTSIFKDAGLVADSQVYRSAD